MKKSLVLLALVWSSALSAESLLELEIVVDGISYPDLKTAQKHIVDNSVIYLGPGEFTTGLAISKNNVILSGSRGTKFSKASIGGKATFITSGNDITIENIECSGVTVSSENGACIRHEGKNLTLINVYFHDSQEGILEAKNDGHLIIKYSRFERLGYKGRAHGIYANGAELLIENSVFDSMVGEGHAIKSRSKTTLVRSSVISSGTGKDSRLFDISNAGELHISNCILYQNDHTVNGQAIGYGLEYFNENISNKITIANNLIVLERSKGNQFLAIPKKINSKVMTLVENNMFVGEFSDEELWSSGNYLFESRKDAMLKETELPDVSSLPNLLILNSSRRAQ